MLKPFLPDRSAPPRNSATANLIARAWGYSARNALPASRVRQDHPSDAALIKAVSEGEIQTRSAVTPFGVGNEAATFSQTSVADLLAIAPAAALRAVSARALNINFDTPVASHSIPSFAADVDGVQFLAPGEPIKVFQGSVDAFPFAPRNVGVITVMSQEIIDTGNDAILRRKLAAVTEKSLDSLFLDATEDDGVRPSGLLFGVTPESSGGATSMAADIQKICTIVALAAGATDNIVLIASTDVALAIQINLPLLKIPVIPSAGLTSSIVALAANNLIVGAGASIKMDTSQETVLHMDSSPSALSTAASPNVTSAPNRSLFQTHCSAIRLRFDLNWAILPTATTPVAAITTVPWVS